MRKRNVRGRCRRGGLYSARPYLASTSRGGRRCRRHHRSRSGSFRLGSGRGTGQVRQSYIRSATETGFKFFADKDDLEYWRALSIPLYLLVHDPDHAIVYWKDVSSYVRQDSKHGSSGVIEMSKADRLDAAFAAHLRTRFDLEIFSEKQYDQVRRELEAIVWSDGTGLSEVSITALDLFVQGLWGLCSKVQFHSSLIADLVRAKVTKQTVDVNIGYTFSRADLYPILSSYFNVLAKFRIAELPVNDINHSMFAKMEFPTFVAPSPRMAEVCAIS